MDERPNGSGSQVIMAADEENARRMTKRKILLEDGRYMIFFTFDEGANAVPDRSEEGVAPSAEDDNV
jgi:hypothetical protein